MTQQQPMEQSPSSPSTGENENEKLFSEVLQCLTENSCPCLQAPFCNAPTTISNIHTNPLIDEPINGFYHILFQLTLDTGLCWVAKMPINGTASKWDGLSASALASEANTMRLLKRETTVPLPDVLDFSSTK